MSEDTNVQNYEDQKVAGIGGWLLVFIIFSAVCLVVGCLKLKKNLEWSETLPEPAIDIYCATFLCGMWFIFYLYCLYLIIVINKNAIKRIKLFLILHPILVDFLIPFVSLGVYAFTVNHVDIIEEFSALYSSMSMVELTAPFVFSLVWYWYFSVSVRVKNTWGAQQ